MSVIRVCRASAAARVSALCLLVIGGIGITLHHLIPAISVFALNRPAACMLKQASGVACIGCRGTRAVFAFANGHVVQSFLFNPMVALAGAGLFGWAIGVTITARNFDLRLSRPGWRLLWILIVAALAGVWIYVIFAERSEYTPEPWPLLPKSKI